MKTLRNPCTKFALAAIGLTIFQSTQSFAVDLVEKDGWKFGISGWVELNNIVDSTRSMSEVLGNSPVDVPNSTNGNGVMGRTQFSARDTRFGLKLSAPETDGWKTFGYVENDFYGAGNTTEAATFNNANMRLRHAYLQADSATGFTILAGQTWELFGWQPYYLAPLAETAPISGDPFSRTTQIRVMKTMKGDGATLQAAIAVARPPQRDAVIPDVQLGVRAIFEGRKAGFSGATGAALRAEPMSIGISSATRHYRTPLRFAGISDYGNVPATAIAVNALVPIIASSGNDISNTLMLGGGYTTGKGYADQFLSYSGNVSNTSLPAGYPTGSFNLDQGLGGYDNFNTFQLVDLRTFNLHLQYHLPSESRYWVTGGYGQLWSDNAAQLVAATGKVVYDRSETAFAGISHQFTTNIRAGFEYAYSRTSYANAQVAHNDRYSLTTVFQF